ncbi:MAG: rhomboid family intramembrane serine protease [Bacteroidetes bacterium]|nr:rhomboid family intramembrane serine protease [Bacteroidota bacterium]
MQNINMATIAIIVANVIISLKGFNDFSFFEKYKFNIAGIRKGEKIRMFSSGFLHADFSHLLFNMITLYFFANVVIISLGVVKFILIYLASLVFGNLLSFFFHKEEFHYSAIGASGAVMGILYSAILFDPNAMLIVFVIPMKAWIFGILFLLFSIYGMKKSIGNIGHDAHFGGAIAGYILTIAFAPYLLDTHLWIVTLLAFPIVLLFILLKLKKI